MGASSRTSVARVVVKRAGASALLRGHPWVWNETLNGTAGAVAGTVTEVRGEDDRLLGWGVLDPTSPIALRMWALAGDANASGLDFPALFVERLTRAAALRRTFLPPDTTAYRLVHGEGDRMPGIVIDRYDAVAVVRPDGEAATALVHANAAGIERVLREAGITTLVMRARDAAKDAPPDVRFGPPPPTPVRAQEHGVPLLADVVAGQKTGAFLDQRDNRARVESLVRATNAQRVLNLYSYAGGFSLRAARAGAIVTSVDIASAAHATAMETFRAADLDPRAHTFVTQDVFAFLERAAREGKTWDLVVSDPPSFAPRETSVERALAAYRKLHAACARVVAPGGVLCAASCSSHVDQARFATTLDDATLARPAARTISVHGAGIDHPTLPAFPEGAYLKFWVLAL